MPNEGKKYLLDTDVLRCVQLRKDSTAIYDALIVAAMAGIVRTVHQVMDELENQLPPVYDILKKYRSSFEIAKGDQYSKPVSDVIELLGNEASYLWPQTGGKNPDPADPWLIGSAKAFGYTVVTNESPRALTRIPAACRLPKLGVPCIRGPHFLLETGIVKDVKFETVEPASFFAGDQG